MPRREPAFVAPISPPRIAPPAFTRAVFGPGHRGVDENDIVRHYLSGALAPEARAAFERHVVDCPECADRILLAEMFKIRERDEWKLTLGSRAGV